jgi:hypothetical protein
MALVRCPECGVRVSTEADMCPNCAYPFSRRKPWKRDKTIIIQKSGDGCLAQIFNAGCSLIVIILLFIFGLIFLVTTCFH